jgi:transposase
MSKKLFWLSKRQWARIEPDLPRDMRVVERVDDRRVISGIVHALRSGCRWCDLRMPMGNTGKLAGLSAFNAQAT